MTDAIEEGATTSAPDTRREAISAALDKVVEAQPEPAAAPEQTAQATPAATEEKPAESRVRAPDGTFAKEAKKAVAANPDAVVEAKPSRKYPSSWKKDHEPVYRELEKDAKYQPILDEVDRREQDLLNGFRAIEDDSKFAKAIRRELAPFEATLRSMGAAPEQAIRGLLSADHVLRYGSPVQKAQAIQRMMRDYGIDSSALQEEQAQAPADPQVQYLAQQLQQLQHQNRQILSEKQAQDLERANADVEAFKKDKPHFEAVRMRMGDLANRGVSTDLQELYNLAIAASPDLQDKVLAERQAKAEAERKAKAQQTAAAAKSAAVSVNGAPPGAAQSRPSKAKDRQSQIREAMNNVLS